MRELIGEFDRVKAAEFQLNFIYPTIDVRRTMNIINRDMTEVEKKATKTSANLINRLIDDVESGHVLIEDLPEDILEKLRALLARETRDG